MIGEAIPMFFTAKGSGYTREDTLMEGGSRDRIGHPLWTLQEALEGIVDPRTKQPDPRNLPPYIGIAMDVRMKGVIPYLTRVSILELEELYNRKLIFRVVDTGGAFMGAELTKLDVCCNTQRHTMEPTLNGPLTCVAWLGETLPKIAW